MSVDFTLRIGDLIQGIIGTVAIPLIWGLVTTLSALKQEISRLTHIVIGADPHDTGLLGKIIELQRESRRHRNWLIEIRAEQGLKLDDRS